MYLTLQNSELLIRRTAEEIYSVMLQHQAFLEALENDSDWAFIIKSHAFLEALLSSLLDSYSGSFRLGAMAARLPMNSADGVSMLELVKANELLNSEQIRFIKKIGEIRNQLAHKIDMVAAFSFDDYIASLDGNQLKNWRRDIAYFELEGVSQKTTYLAVQEPRLSIAEALLDIICQVEESRVLAKNLAEGKVVAERDTKELLDSLMEKQGVEVKESRTITIELGGVS
jgi:hypothetical protein